MQNAECIMKLMMVKREPWWGGWIIPLSVGKGMLLAMPAKRGKGW